MSKNLVNGDSLKKYHVGVNTPHESKVLVNENVTSFKVGTSNVTGVDYTEQMEQSIITLDDIKGVSDIVTSNDGIKRFKNLSIKNIFTLNENNTIDYFESAIIDSGNANSTKDGANIMVNINNASWGHKKWKVTGLTPGEVYCVSIDSVVLNSGGSAIEVSGAKKMDTSFIKHSDHVDTSSQNHMIVTALSDSMYIYFYCTLTKQENGDVIYKNVKVREVKRHSSVDLNLKSVRNVSDTFSNNIVKQRISSITVNGTLGYSSDLGSFTNVYRCFVIVPPFNSPGDINDSYSFESTYSEYNYDYSTLDSEHYYLHEKYNQVCLFISKSKVDNLPGDTINDKIMTYLNRNPLYINYVHSGVIRSEIDSSIIANSNDTLFTDSNRDFTTLHTVQLNTKAQVEKLQNNNKSIWQKIKECTDVSINLNPNGYIKLPTIMGGLLIQWGKHDFTLDGNGYNWSRLKYTTPFSRDVFYSSVGEIYIPGTDSFNVISRTSPIDANEFYLNSTGMGNNSTFNKKATVKWFAIGR